MVNPFLNKELEEYLNKRKKNSEVEIVSSTSEEAKEEGTIKKPWFIRIFSMFSNKERSVSEEVVEIEEEIDDKEEKTKKLLKAMHKWLSMLPPEKISEFKNSEDYELYKDVLAIYGLIRTNSE